MKDFLYFCRRNVEPHNIIMLMKKIFIAMTMALATLAGNAQTVNVSTYSGTDMTPHAGQVKNVICYRQMFKGWNTVSMPYSMTEAQVNEAFGADCRLEKLAGVSQSGNTIYLNFADVKAGGIEANTPYILYYTGESKSVKISVKEVRMDNMPSQISFVTSEGVRVSMNGADVMKEGSGLYGIRVVDNAEANFVDVTEMASKFYATRCYVEVNGAQGAKLITTHNAGTTGIGNVQNSAVESDAAYNIAGQKVGKNAKGIKIINGKKQL